MAESERFAAHAETLDYRLAAAGREAAEDERLDLLEQIYDPVSRRRRALVQPGWRCLEVGAGRGSMAVWLAGQVGATGHVVATDVDTRYLSRLELPNLEVIEHNILEDPLDVLGPGSFDLVCSRLMLFHLQGRQEQAIRQMAECLRPGGWLVRDEGSTEVVRGGSPWARWWIPTLEVINGLGGGDEASRREVEVMTSALADPTYWLQRELLHACWGRRASDSS